MKLVYRTMIATATLVGMLWTGVTQAHTDDYLDSVGGKHGGQLRMAGPWHFELVLDKTADGQKPAPVTVYLTDHGDNAIATTGASSKITIISNNKPVQVQLTEKAPNMLVGEAVYKAQPELKAVVQLTLKGESQNARFAPFAKPATEQPKQDEGHHHHH